MKQLSIVRFVGIVFGVAWLSSAGAQNRVTVPLTDPARPATLEVVLFNGSVTVTGYDGDEILIATSGDDDNEDEHEEVFEDDDDDDEPARDRTGLRQIRNTAFGMTAEEDDNVVSISVDRGYRGIDLDISVPHRTSVHARTVNGEEIRIEGVTGEHELANINGDIIGIDVRGSAVVNSQNGDVDMSFMELTPGKAMSFNSFNGDIEVAFPPSLAANLSIGAGRGDVYTDFEMQLQPHSSVTESGGNGGRRQVRIENSMHGVVGAGGSEIQFQSFNGDIVIRKR